MITFVETLDEQAERILNHASDVNAAAEKSIATHILEHGKPSIRAIYDMTKARLVREGWPILGDALWTFCVDYHKRIWENYEPNQNYC